METLIKELPFEGTSTLVPREVITIYPKHPDFNSASLSVYVYLRSCCGSVEQFEGITQDLIADELYLSRPTVIKALKSLEKMGLIEIKKKRANNNGSIYKFLEPVHSLEELISEYPCVEQNIRNFEESRKKDKRR